MSRLKVVICFLLCQFVFFGFAQEKKKAKKPSFSEVWQYELESPEDSSTIRSMAITAPILFEEEKVFFASINGFVFALNAEDGTKVWNFNAGNSIRQSLVSSDERIFFTTEKEIFCINKADGQPVWQKGLGIEITSPLAYFNEMLYLATSANNICCLDGKNGEILWEYAIGALVYSCLTIFDGILLVGADNGYIHSLLCSDGRLLWKLEIGGKIRAAPLIYEGHLYVGSYDNYIYVINIGKKKVKWKVRTGADIQASAVVWKDYLFVASFDSNLYCFNRGNGHLHYRKRLPARPYNTPIIINNVMYIQTLSNKLIAIAPETGKGLSSFNSDALITSPLTVSLHKDRMFFGTNIGTLVALSFRPKDKKDKPEEEEATEDKEDELGEEEPGELGELGEEEVSIQLEKAEEKAEEKVEEGIKKPFEEIELDIPYDKELQQKCMELYSQENYAGAAIGWAEMIAKLKPQYYTIVVGLYCTSDSLKKIYENDSQKNILFFLPKPYQGKICYQVCLGIFSSSEEAQAKLNELPEFFQQEKPITAKLSNLLR